eukprot:9489884-Alexandrium_andersonii.AAC.1
MAGHGFLLGMGCPTGGMEVRDSGSRRDIRQHSESSHSSCCCVTHEIRSPPSQPHPPTRASVGSTAAAPPVSGQRLGS